MNKADATLQYWFCSVLRWVIRTIKLLLLKTGHVCELAIVELDGGWEMLASPEEHYRGVGRLAR